MIRTRLLRGGCRLGRFARRSLRGDGLRAFRRRQLGVRAQQVEVALGELAVRPLLVERDGNALADGALRGIGRVALALVGLAAAVELLLDHVLEQLAYLAHPRGPHFEHLVQRRLGRRIEMTGLREPPREVGVRESSWPE